VISEFEARLADALGTHIGAPFAGLVDVAPGQDPGTGVRLAVGVVDAQVIDSDLGSRRGEVVPGDSAPRRALRLRCTVALEARMKTIDRKLQLRALDAALYALDEADFRNGSLLADGTDRGFVIHELQAASVAVPLAPDAEDAGPAALRLTATGFFWPVGVKGKAGDIIHKIHFRGGVLPLEVLPAEPVLVAGGPAVVLTIRFDTAGIMVIEKEGVSKLPFGKLAVTLVGKGAKPGKGTLSGGEDGIVPEEIRLIPVTDDAATVTYTPPAEPAAEELVVALDDGKKGLGIELGRVPLLTRGA
jgi:hypothetical protein